jgi:transcriptional regulator with XRE-family HTH domain
MSELGETLVRLRTSRQMSQRGLARASGLTPSYVSKIESDSLQSVPSMEAVTSLARALDEDPLQLLSAAGRVPSPFEVVASQPAATRFFRRAAERIRDPGDWDRLTDLLDSSDFGSTAGEETRRA